MVSMFFFQQGNDTHTVLHIIDNIELKLDFANLKSQIKSQYLSKKKSQFDIFPQIAQPYTELTNNYINQSKFIFIFFNIEFYIITW